MFEFDLPFRVRAEGVSAMRFALSLEGEHFARVIEDRGRGVLFRAGPSRIGQRTERRCFLPDPDIAGHHEGLFEWDKEFRIVGKFDRQHFVALRTTHFLQSLKSPDAVFEMDDQFALVQIAKIYLGALRPELRRSLQAPPAVGRGATEKFRRRQHDEIRGRKTESAGQGALQQFDSA